MLTPGTWILIGTASFLVAGGSVCMLLLSLRRPKIQLDDQFDSDRTRSDLFKGRTSAARKELFEGMAKVSSAESKPVVQPIDSSVPATPPPAQLAEEQQDLDPPMETDLWKGLWHDITDQSMVGSPDASNAIAGEAQGDEAQADPSMQTRPDTCPFCDATPMPDYVPHEVEGGVIYFCPSCRCITYVVPKGIAHMYMGRTYLVPEGQDFVPPASTSIQQMKDTPMPSSEFQVNQDGCVVGLFDDIIDPAV